MFHIRVHLGPLLRDKGGKRTMNCTEPPFFCWFVGACEVIIAAVWCFSRSLSNEFDNLKSNMGRKKFGRNVEKKLAETCRKCALLIEL